MVAAVVDMLLKCWTILCQLAPWLLLGMLLSGLLHVLLPAGFIRQRFQGWMGVVKAVILGVPLPLCSCGVIPAGIGLKNQGASDGAAVGFLISTPQTGVDSILVSASFFGWPFALFKMFAAAITGIVGGILADRQQIRPQESQRKPEDDVDRRTGNPFVDAWNHAIEIVRSIWIWLVIGVVVSAAIEQWVPSAWFETVGSWGIIPSMFLALAISTPLYVCATASVPIAAALVAGGLPAAAAMVFLMAGPATNITTIGAIHSRFGIRTTVVYLATLILGSGLFGYLFSSLLTATVNTVQSHQHDHQNWVSIASALFLLILVGGFLWSDMQRWLNRSRVAQSDANKLTLRIDGMSCQNCVNSLETAIGRMDGVSNVAVDLKNSTATVIGQIKPSELTSTIESLGFRVIK